MSPALTVAERPQVRGHANGRDRKGSPGRKRRRARARAPRVPDLVELLRSAQQPLDHDPLSQPASPPAYDFSRLRIHDDAEEADQRQPEILDPATLGIRMATDVLRSLRGDPQDRSQRVQLQVARIDDPDLSSAVLGKLRVWLPSSEYARVTGLVAQAKADASQLPLQSRSSPEPVEEPDPQGDLVLRDDAAVSDATNLAQLQAERLPRDAQTHAEQVTADAQRSRQAADARQQETGKRQAADAATAGQQAAAAGADRAAAAEQHKQDAMAAALRAKQDQAMTAHQGQQRAKAQQGRAERAAAEQREAAVKREGGPGVVPPRPVPHSGGPVAPVNVSAGGTPPVALDKVDALANAPGGPLARHQMRDAPGNAAEHQPDQAPPGEEPIGAEPADLPEIDTPEPVLPELPAQQPVPAAAYLPAQDIDVSGVPTADQLKLPESGALPPAPAAPSFPQPPPPAMVAPRPGEQDPEEAMLAAQARREGATIETAPGQVGPDAAETEPDVAPESVAAGPEVMPAGAAEPENVTDDAAGGPGAASDSVTSADAASAQAGAAGAASAQADAAGTGADGGPGGAGPGGAAPAPGGTAPGALPQDASLEPGGGGSAGGPEPALDAGPAGGGPAPGGGAPAGGGGSAAPPPQPPAPDVSKQQPETALAVVGRLPVVQLARGLSGVTASVGHSVGQQRDALAKSPPEAERPSGAPKTLHGLPPVAAPASYGPDKVQKAAAQGPGQQAQPQGKQVAGGPTPADQVPAPKVTGNAKGGATAADVRNVQQAVNNVPTTDPMLDHASVGVAPKVQLTGQADPALTDTQLTSLRDRGAKILVTGRDDATRPLGEDQIYPDVPHEILKASVPKGGPGPAPGAAGGAGGPGGVVDPGPAGEQAVSSIAQQERAPQIQSAIAQGQSKMTSGEQARQREEARERREHSIKLAAAMKKHAAEEEVERRKAAAQARQHRTAWQDQQNKLTTDADTEAGQKHDKARGDVAKKKSDTDSQVDKRQQTDNSQITAKRQEAESKARSEQSKKQNDSGGWFGWVTSKISEAFNALVSLVKGIFDAARKFVQGVIDKFKTFVTGLIDAARKAIIGLISAFASAILAIGDTLLAAFPALRDKFRKLIIGLRDAAIAEVNKIANALKSAVTALLDLLGKALSALLNVLQQQLLAAIATVQKTVQGVIDFVKSTIALMGEFAAIVKDVAADPGGWVRKLGAAVMDGVRFFLWGALVSAVKNWFVQQIQQILGLTQVVKFAAGAVAGGVAVLQNGQQWLAQGQQLLSVLLKGGISLPKIIGMAWQALIQALPQILIQLAIEKLVSLIVPAIGGIIQIVQGVIAAYNSIKSIVAAINKFVTFLKAVKAGTAARPFANAVAAGAVALLNFLSQPLLEKVKGLAKKIDGKLQEIAQKILGFLMRGVNAVRKGLGKAFNLAKRGAKAALNGIKRAAKAAGRLAKRGLAKLKSLAKRGLRATVNGIRALGRRLAKTKLGKFLKNIYSKVKAKYQSFKSKLTDWRNKFQKWRDNRKKNKPNPEKRLEVIVERIRPELQSMLKRGIRRVILRAVLVAMRLWYRLSGLAIQGNKPFSIVALLNPVRTVINGIPADFVLKLLHFVHDLGAKLEAESKNRASQLVSQGLLTPGKQVDVQKGALPIDVQAAVQEISGVGAMEESVTRYHLEAIGSTGNGGDAEGGDDAGANQPIISVIAQQQPEGYAGRHRRRRDPSSAPQLDPTNVLVKIEEMNDYPKYREFFRFLRGKTRQERQAIAELAQQAILGNVVDTPEGKMGVTLAHWLVHVEGRRSPSTFVTGMMAIDLAAMGRRDLKNIVKRFPMSPLGAKGQAKDLRSFLKRYAQFVPGPKKKRPFFYEGSSKDIMIGREFKVIRMWLASQAEAETEAWIASLEDIDFDSEVDVNAKLNQLQILIEKKMRKAWGLVDVGQSFGNGDEK